jgi:O-antigen/teichoic acid export membrane protein
MQETKKFAFDVGITFLASVVTIPLGFIITVALGRYLGAGDLGLYRMTSTIYGLVALIATFGIPSATIKYVAEYKEERDKTNQIVSSGIIISSLLGIVFTALFYFLAASFASMFEMPDLSHLLKILSPIFPFVLVNGTLLGLLNGIRQMKKHAAATILQSILMIAITVPLIYYGFGVAGAVIGTVSSSVGTWLFLILTTRNYFEITFKNYILTAKKILSFSWKILMASAINQVNYWADTLLIGYFLTSDDLGHYAVAISFSRFLWLIPNAVQRITYPTTSTYWAKKNYTALNKMIDKSMKHTASILLPMGLVTGLFARDIITLIFGEAFIHSVLPLQILIIGTVTNGAITRCIGGSLSGIGRPDIGLKIVSVSAATNIVLNILLIPRFGITGGAIATTVSLTLLTLLAIFFIRKMLKVKIDFQWLVQIFGLALLSILVFIYLDFINRYFIGAVILCFYLIIIITIFLTKEDRTYFMELLREIFSLIKRFV